MGQALVKQPLSKWEKSQGLLVHYRREGLPPEPPAPRCKVCGVNLIFNLGINITGRKHRKMPEYCKIHVPSKMPAMRHIVALLLLALSSVIITHGQGGNIGSNFTPTVNRQGIPIPGASISVCQPLTTTGASVNNNVATLTMLSNPQTAGFVQGMTVMVAGFSAADTYFNAGAIQGGQISGGAVILSVGPTTITYNLIHASATASTNGTVLQEGNATTPCAGLSSIYVDPQLQTPRVNPFQSDQLGNWNAFVQPGIYFTQISAPFTTTIRQMVITGGGGVFSYPCVVTVASTSWTCGHNLNAANIGWSCYNSTTFPSSALFPDSVVLTSTNVATINWVNPTTGVCIIFTTVPAATVAAAAVQTLPSGPQTIANSQPLSQTGPFNTPTIDSIVFMDGGVYANVAAAVAAMGSSGELYIPPGTYSINNSAGPLVISQSNVYIHGAGRNITTLQCTTATQDCIQFIGAKPRFEGVAISYASQANVANYALRITNTGQMRANEVYLETNIGSGVLIESTALNSSDNVNDNEFRRMVVGACTGTGMTLTGSATNRRVINTTLDEVQLLNCTNNGMLFNDWVQGTYVSHSILQFNGRGMYINPTATSRTFDTFIQNDIFDATSTNEQVRATNTSDLRIMNSWFGQTGTGFYQIYMDSGVTRSEINDSYIGDQNVIQPGDIFLNGNTTIVRNNHFIENSVPSTAAVVVNSGASFNDVESNTFEGFAANKWISDGGTSTRKGPNYGDQSSPANAAYFGSPVQVPAAMQTAANTWAGVCTLGTSCAVTFPVAYTATPSCIGTDTTAANAVKSNPSTTGVTFTGTGTDVLDWVCVGNPN